MGRQHSFPAVSFCIPKMVKAMVATLFVGVAADFESWAQEFGMTFNGEEATIAAKANWMQRDEYITKTNAEQLSYTVGHNQFSAMSRQEFTEFAHGGVQGESSTDGAYLGRHEYNGEALPTEIDWSTKGAVTAVKNQGHCGSCWAFSTTGSMEGANQIASGKLASLSEQQLVDCSKANGGCQGGLMDLGFKFAEVNEVCSEQSYPYKGIAGTCATSCSAAIPKGGVSGYKDVAPKSMKDMMSAVAQQPVSIAIDASTDMFQSYKSGVLTGRCGSTLDHGVLTVGYGTEAGTDYWKVKNSWASVWGDAGYVKLQRGKKFASAGECGLLSQPSYPVVSASVSV